MSMLGSGRARVSRFQLNILNVPCSLSLVRSKSWARPEPLARLQLVIFKPGAEIVLGTQRGAHLMLVGGEPFPEQRHIYWNFVSSSKDRIEQAKDDWRNRRFPEIAGETEFIPLPPDCAPTDPVGAAAPKAT